jgi:hypothetical protein
MKSQIDHLEFVVNSLEEIKTLLDVWEEIASVVFHRMAPDILRNPELAGFNIVGVDMDRGPEPSREVFLVFLAPRPMVEQLLKTLRKMGLKFTKQVDEEESITRCRLIPAAPQP